MMHTIYSIEQLRTEFAQHDLSGFLWQWLFELLTDSARSSIVPRYRAAVYSPSGGWDNEGLADLANGFIVDHVIPNGLLATALVRSPDVPALIGYICRSFKRYVIDQRPKSTTRNVFDRLRDVLDESSVFIRMAGVPPRSYYGLAEWVDDQPEVASDEDLRFAERYLPTDISWLTYETGDRQSPGLTSEDLLRIASEVMRGTSRLVSAQQLMSLVERRFELDSSVISIADSGEERQLATPDDDPFDVVVAREIAEKVLARCTERQRRIVFEMLKQGGDVSSRSIAAALGISKSTAANEMQRIQAHFRDCDVAGERQMRQLLDAIETLGKAS